MATQLNTSSRHVFETLREVCASREPLGVAEISRRLGLSLSTAQRALLTLSQTGYLKRHPYVAKYRTGHISERLVNALLERFTIRPASVIFLQRLAADSRLTASLYVRLGWYSIRLVGIEASNTPMPHARRLGEAALLDSDAPSLAILASLDTDEQERFARIAHTEAHADWRERARQIRAAGCAFQAEDPQSGFASLAFPLPDASGHAVASVAIEGRQEGAPLDRHPQIDAWRDVVAELSQLLQTKRNIVVNPFAHLNPDDIRFGPRELNEAERADEDAAPEAATASAPRGAPVERAKLLASKVAVITGGASGMGRESALRFLEEGAAVVIADRNDALGLETLELARAAGHRDVRYLHTDVSREDEVRGLIEHAVREFGRIDCVFNNAGAAGPPGPLLELSAEQFRTVLDTNLLGIFFGLKHGGRALKAQGEGGTLIATASLAALMKMTAPSAYAVAKAAVIKLVQELAVELGPHNIRVNSIAPGAILTPMYKGDASAWRELLRKSAPLPQVGEPRDIADAAVFLASDLSKFVNGTTLIVDGGMHAESGARYNILKATQPLPR